MEERFEVKGYRVDGRLGAGSQGETFSAVEVETGRAVALKRLRFSDAPDWKSIELFEREGKALAGLEHPGIARHIASFTVRENGGGETFFNVQELVDGESLDRRLSRGIIWSPDEVVGFIREMARILAFIHTRKPAVIHRDIKPSNIIVRASGAHTQRYVLIDFGALQLVTPKLRMDGGSTIVGTSGYMPPEQLLGRTGPESDLYALGATAVHLLTGVHPSQTPLKRLRLDWRATLPRGVVVPERLGACLDMLLAPAVEDRFARAEAVVAALDAKPTPKRPVVSAAPGHATAAAAEPAQPRRGARSLAAAMAVFIVAVYAAVFVGWCNEASTPSPQSHDANWYELVPEVRDIPPLPAVVVVDERLARTEGFDAGVLKDGLELTPRSWNGHGGSEFVAASFLLQWQGVGAVADLRGRARLLDADGEVLDAQELDLVPSWEAPLHAGDIVGVAMNFRTKKSVAAASIVVEVQSAKLVPAEAEQRRPLDVKWAAPAPDGVSLAFEVLSVVESVAVDRRSHRPRIAVTNRGTAPVVSLRLTKELDDPHGRVAPVNKPVWAIPVHDPSLLPGETRVISAWSYEHADLSDWRLVVDDIRTGLLKNEQVQ